MESRKKILNAKTTCIECLTLVLGFCSDFDLEPMV